MRTLGVRIKENHFYAPYEDECWVELAKAIMDSYAIKYSCQIPTTASTQEEYNKLDKKTFLPIRKSILQNVINGPLGNIADIRAIYRGFELKRKEYKRTMGVIWEDTDYSDYLL